VILGAIWSGSVAAFGAGVLLWTLLEYAMHRFAFHGFAPHYQHHAEPREAKYIVTPLWFSVVISAALFALVRALCGSWPLAGGIAAGAIAGYLFYEWLHHRIHRSPANGRLLRLWRKHHYHHHFTDTDVCYGVTSPLWDVVFGTMRSVYAPSRGAKP
jgi:sterol desaturase/sphingolipid hydroxylase (fatty acid hydroxylase superfamily)